MVFPYGKAALIGKCTYAKTQSVTNDNGQNRKMNKETNVERQKETDEDGQRQKNIERHTSVFLLFADSAPRLRAKLRM